MVGLGRTEADLQRVQISNLEEVKSVVMWGVYRALWLWLLTWLGIGIVVGLIVLFLGGGLTRLATAKEDAYLASMKSDLRNLVTMEEYAFSDSVKYFRIHDGRIAGIQFTVTTGNSMPVVTVTRDGWTATISSTNTTKTCAIFIGSVSIPPAIREGMPECN